MSTVSIRYFKCDRCGRTSEGDTDPLSHGWGPYPTNIPDQVAFHMCPDCAESFAAWANGQATAALNNTTTKEHE